MRACDAGIASKTSSDAAFLSTLPSMRDALGYAGVVTNLPSWGTGTYAVGKVLGVFLASRIGGRRGGFPHCAGTFSVVPKQWRPLAQRLTERPPCLAMARPSRALVALQAESHGHPLRRGVRDAADDDKRLVWCGAAMSGH